MFIEEVTVGNNISDVFFSFNGENLKFSVSKYIQNDSPAIQIMDQTGLPYAVLTVNVPDAKLDEGEFCIKNWSENYEIVQKVSELNLFEDTGKVVPTGYVEAPVWRLKEGVSLE